jgi:hypothetical protein
MQHIHCVRAVLAFLLVLEGTSCPMRSVLANEMPLLSHLGQHILDHVTLISQDGDNNCQTSFHKILVRMLPNGTLSSGEFQVPPNRLLVITDVTWATFPTVQLIVGETLHLAIDLKLLDRPRIYSVIETNQTIDTAEGEPGGSVHLVSGVVVGSGIELCPNASMITPSSSVSIRLNHVTINGYLIDTPLVLNPPGGIIPTKWDLKCAYVRDRQRMLHSRPSRGVKECRVCGPFLPFTSFRGTAALY